jgi:hypothetical protein
MGERALAKPDTANKHAVNANNTAARHALIKFLFKNIGHSLLFITRP